MPWGPGQMGTAPSPRGVWAKKVPKVGFIWASGAFGDGITFGYVPNLPQGVRPGVSWKCLPSQALPSRVGKVQPISDQRQERENTFWARKPSSIEKKQAEGLFLIQE